MAKTVFVSIVHEDKRYVVNSLLNWNHQGLIESTHFKFEQEDFSKEDDHIIKNYLKKRMDESQVVIFVVGKDTHSHHWVHWEYSYAQTKPNTKLVFFHIKDLKGGLPAIFPVGTQTHEFNLENYRKYV